jgi:protein-tyrosine-phosphatase
MSAQKSILFVCTGNIFRSVSAEECFKKYLSDNDLPEWKVGSAGITADKDDVDPQTIETLAEFGIEASHHQQRKLSREMLEEYYVVVGMAENHISFMKSELEYEHAVLFNDLAVNEETSVLDIQDEVPDYQNNRPAMEKKIERTVRDIHEKTPQVYKNALERFYLLSELPPNRVS